MWTNRNKSEESILDMTPLVDVVFLLIIFFMLSTTFIVLPGIQVNLPKASSEQVTVEKKEIVVSVSRDGAFFFNKDPVDDTTMNEKLRSTAVATSDIQVLLKGDAGCDYGRVVKLLDMIRSCNLRRVAILTTTGASESDGKNKEQ